MKIFNYTCTLVLSTLALCATLAPSARADPLVPLTLSYDTEIVSMDLTGTFPLPLGPNWTPVLTKLSLSESPAHISKGEAHAQYAGIGSDPATPGDIQDGDQFRIDSFFDVFFDIKVEDVDPGADFGSPLPSLISVPHSGDPADAAHMILGGDPDGTQGFRIADTSKPNFGLFPIQGDVYIGHVPVDIKLPFSIGGDPTAVDRVQFVFSAHNVGDVSAVFLVLPDGTVVEEFDSSAPLLGSIEDDFVDPPFGPFDLIGPTTVHSKGPQPEGLPEPSTFALVTLGLLGLVGFGSGRRRHR